MRELVKLRDLVQQSTGSRNPSRTPSETFIYVDVSAVDNLEKTIATPRWVTGADAPSRARKIVRAGDVLVSTVRPNLNAVALVPSELDGQIASTGFCVLRPKEGVLPQYLFYFVRSPAFVEGLSSLVAGALYPAVTDAQVLEQSIPFLPMIEQRRIVDVLSRAEGIVRLRREAEKKAAELIPALFIDMFGDPATNPRGWPVQQIGELGRVQLGRQRAPKYQTGQHRRPYMRVANVFEDRIDLSDVLEMDFDDKDYHSYKLEPGDILLNEGQSTELVGRPAMWRGEIDGCCFQNTLVRFQPKKSLMTPEFALAAMLHCYRSGVLSNISSKTSNVAHLGANRFARLTLFRPPMDLQERFSTLFESIRSIRAQQATAACIARKSFDALLARTFNLRQEQGRAA